MADKALFRPKTSRVDWVRVRRCTTCFLSCVLSCVPKCRPSQQCPTLQLTCVALRVNACLCRAQGLIESIDYPLLLQVITHCTTRLTLADVHNIDDGCCHPTLGGV